MELQALVYNSYLPYYIDRFRHHRHYYRSNYKLHYFCNLPGLFPRGLFRYQSEIHHQIEGFGYYGEQVSYGGVNLDAGVTTASVKMNSPFNFIQITNYTALQAYDDVLKYAGASYKRDAVDTRVVQEVKNGTVTFNGSKTGLKGIIDSQTDVGGWPVLQQSTPPADTDNDGMPDAWETSKGLDPNVANANGKNLSTVYDNIEVYINSIK